MAAYLRERERNLFGQAVGLFFKHAHDAPEMNGGEEALQIEIADQFAADMPKRIGLDAALSDKTVDRGPSLVNGVQHLIQLSLNDLEGTGRGCDSSRATGSLGNIESAVIVRFVEVIAQQLRINIEEARNRVASRQGRECLAQCVIGGSQSYAQGKKRVELDFLAFRPTPCDNNAT